jgi:hypothetical protein
MYLDKKAIDHILDVYANVGGDEARALAPVYGITTVYVKKLACMHGVKVKRKVNHKPETIKKRLGKGKPRQWNDPRWQRAAEIGPVLA